MPAVDRLNLDVWTEVLYYAEGAVRLGCHEQCKRISHLRVLDHEAGDYRLECGDHYRAISAVVGIPSSASRSSSCVGMGALMLNVCLQQSSISGPFATRSDGSHNRNLPLVVFTGLVELGDQGEARHLPNHTIKMSNEKKDLDGVGLDIEAPGITKGPIEMPSLPKPLTLEEKKYMLAVERGDLAYCRRIIQRAHRRGSININCVDPLGRGALTLAIDGENLEMLEVLVVMGVKTKDALLHAINVEFVEAVELLLEYEELVHKEGEPYSWENVDWNISMFTPDITPLILAAHRNNYEILKILLDRGATLPMPHDIKCGCEECLRDSNEDSLRHSMSRVNEYRALASPSLIALSSNDPILTAFQLSWELPKPGLCRARVQDGVLGTYPPQTRVWCDNPSTLHRHVSGVTTLVPFTDTCLV
ncbi:unnamed protein product [Timema podura]|uniref:Transient receptor ion channel domain-containing protein n=1 Tax=Timema podura TaxID=61482 RepID=A0ABN7P3T3_TIMPD|nr:unnamed protein product [Timema podura]